MNFWRTNLPSAQRICWMVKWWKSWIFFASDQYALPGGATWCRHGDSN
jgi:hypothetical protein